MKDIKTAERLIKNYGLKKTNVIVDFMIDESVRVNKQKKIDFWLDVKSLIMHKF